MGSILNDLRFAFRTLSKSPGFTLMAALALCLGIGANTAIFSVVNAMLLQRMPFLKPDRLVMVWEQSPRTTKKNVINPTNFVAWLDRNHSFDRLAALVQFDTSISGDGEPEVISNLAVSDGFFQILGVQPILGRWFTRQEDTPGNDRVAILSEGLWRRRYGADPNILGRKIRLNGRDFLIVGVMPAGFRFPQTQAELWQPLAIDRTKVYGGRYLSSVARLRDGATVGSAQADMDVIAGQLQKERPDYDSKWGITVVGLREQATGDVRTALLVLLGAVGLVLLIACANVANLMLIRAAGRSREIAVRAALGASGSRIARQLLVESLLLAAIGGALGLLFGRQMITLLVAALPDTIAYANLKDIHLDLTVFVFAAIVTLLTGVLFGTAPAWKAARTDIQESLRDGGRTVAGSRSLIRHALIVAEVALSMMLLVGAGLLIRSLSKLTTVNPGFDPQHVLSMQLATNIRDDHDLLRFDQQLLDRVRALPGVEAAGSSHYLPLGRTIPGTGMWRADQPRPAHGEEPVTEVLVVMPGYFAALNIPLIRGRVFDDRDRNGTPHSIVVNQALAKQFYRNEDPIGKILTVQWGKDPYQIIGVVGDVHQNSLDKEIKPEVFICNLQEPTGPLYIVARTHGDPRALAKAIEHEVHAIKKDVALSDIKTMDQYVSEQVAAPRFNTILLGGFAALALVLAAVGIFGVISYSVTQRRQEIGIRRALGADAANVMALVIRQGMGLTAVGMAIGIAGAFAVTRLLQSLLFGVTPTDPLTFSIVAAVLAFVAFAASFLPAWRASHVDPAEALRHE
jgi:putative ABC transport system permease protein